MSASNSVTVPVGSSLTPRSLQFNGAASISLMLTSFLPQQGANIGTTAHDRDSTGRIFGEHCRRRSVSLYLRFMATYQAGAAWLALADGTRRSIVERLAHGPLAVGELARQLPVSRPAVSQHLKVLKSAGLVRDRASGTRRVYQLDPTGLQTLRADLDRFWTQALATYAQTVDETGGDPA
jgi:DNA-binding transcriptional ArsR family regulator